MRGKRARRVSPVRPTQTKWYMEEGGRGRTQPKSKEVGWAQFLSSRSQVGCKGPGHRKLWEGVDASREFRRDAEGRFLESGTTLVASSQSLSCTVPFWGVTLGC